MTPKALDRYRAWALYTAILLLATFMRAYHLGARPLWIDEAFSVWMARHPWQEIWTWTVRVDQHPPGYYGLLHLWGRAWGWSEVSVRALSLLAGVLTLLPVMHAADMVAGKRAAFVVGVLLALSPFHIAYAQEARMYTWMTLAVALALWGILRLRRQPRDRWGALALGMGASGALWLHNMSIFFLLVLVVWGAFWHRPWGDRAHGWYWALFPATTVWLLWVPALVRQARGVLHRFWIPYPTWRTPLDALHTFHWGVIASAAVPFWVGDAVWLGLAALGGWSVWRRQGRDTASLLVGMSLLPIAMALVVSLLRPLFLPRVFLWVTLPYVLLTAVGLNAVRQRGRGYALFLFGGLIALSLASWVGYDADYAKEDWRGAAAYVVSRAQPGDLVLFNAGWAQLPFDYYAAPLGLAVEEHGLPADLFSRGELEPEMKEADVPRLLSLVRGRARVWLVYSHAWYTDPRGIIPRVLNARMTLAEERRFVGIRVVLYSREGEGGSGE